MIFKYGQYKYKLVFRYNDRATYALLYGEQFLLTKGFWVECYKAKATRSPKDQDEKAMGRLIAFERLVELVPNPELKKEMRRCFYRNCSLPTSSSLRAYRLEQREAKWRLDAKAS